MSTAELFTIPKQPGEWSFWMHANADSHYLIVNAINKKFGTTLAPFVLNPAPEHDYQNFLEIHQFMHTQLDGVLGIGGNDYSSLDFDNPTAVEYIFQQHANEHVLAHSILGI